MSKSDPLKKWRVTNSPSRKPEPPVPTMAELDAMMADLKARKAAAAVRKADA